MHPHIYVVPTCVYVHTRTRVCAHMPYPHTYTYTCVRAHTCAAPTRVYVHNVHACIHAVCTCAHMCVHVYMLCLHLYARARACMHTRHTYACIRAPIYACVHVYMCTHVHARIYAVATRVCVHTCVPACTLCVHVHVCTHVRVRMSTQPEGRGSRARQVGYPGGAGSVPATSLSPEPPQAAAVGGGAGAAGGGL